MLDFQINNDNFIVLFGAYVAFFAVVYGVSSAITLLIEKSNNV